MTFQTIQTVLLHFLSYLNPYTILACLFLFLHQLPHWNKAILQSCLILLSHAVERWRVGEEVLVIVKMREEGVDFPLVFYPSVGKRLLKAKKDLDSFEDYMHEVEKSIVDYHRLLWLYDFLEEIIEQ